MLDAKIPDGPLEDKWSHYRSTAKLVSPGNRRKLHVIVVGTGLAGSSLAASLGEMGYRVTCFCFQDTARRAHSVAIKGRSRGRLPRGGRIDVLRRVDQRRIMRSSLPRRTPDGRWGSGSQRPGFRFYLRLGVGGRRPGTNLAQGTAALRFCNAKCKKL